MEVTKTKNTEQRRARSGGNVAATVASPLNSQNGGKNIMLNETAEQKEKRIFEHYKKDLLVLADYGSVDSLRFVCIQYQCSFPEIDPYKMAAVLVGYGIKILFDDSSISKAENKRKENKVRRLVAEQNKTEA